MVLRILLHQMAALVLSFFFLFGVLEVTDRFCLLGFDKLNIVHFRAIDTHQYVHRQQIALIGLTKLVQ
jgi:hypothetical protein